MKKTYHIEGMHCKACELLMKQSVAKEIPGCQVTQANHKQGTVAVTRQGEEDTEKFAAVVEKCGYQIKNNTSSQKSSAGGRTKRPTPSMAEALIIIGSALVFAWILISVDVFGFIASMEVNASLGVIVLLGLVASVSTCLAVTGGVIMGFTELIEDGDGRKAHARVHGGFHLGRVLGFFVLGAVLGGVGQFVSIGLGFAPYMNAFIALIFVYLGLQILGIVPSLSSLGVSMPESWSNKVFHYKNPYLAPIVGALTFFLPCGFTQSVQFMALASGSWVMGGLMMAVFAAGTIPGLLALGMGTSFAKDNRKAGFEKIVAGILLVFGFFTLWGSAAIMGWTNAAPSQDVQDVVVDEQSIIELTIGHNGYQLVPETTTIESGKNYRVTITPSQNGLGCMTTVKAPRISNQIYNVVAGQPMVFDIVNANGSYNFVCAAMGMKQGEIVALADK